MRFAKRFLICTVLSALSACAPGFSGEDRRRKRSTSSMPPQSAPTGSAGCVSNLYRQPSAPELVRVDGRPVLPGGLVAAASARPSRTLLRLHGYRVSQFRPRGAGSRVVASVAPGFHLARQGFSRRAHRRHG